MNTQPLGGLLEFYSFDTTAIINGRRDLYPPSAFEALWASVDSLIESGQVRCVDEVKRELKRKDDEASQWASLRPHLFMPLEHDIQRAVKGVLKACPRLIMQTGANRNGADPFVIALAMVHSGTVVTQEVAARRDGDDPAAVRKPKIPDACEIVGVRSISFAKFVEEQGWQFVRIV